MDEGLPIDDEGLYAAKARYFDPLCRKLRLWVESIDVSPRCGAVTAVDDDLRLVLEHERGLINFCVEPVSGAVRRVCVDWLSERFPRIRLLPFGGQRLTLGEQCAFLESRWPELREMYRGPALEETRRWLKARNVYTYEHFPKRSE